jgi:uncharacterized protein (TIGR00255 family)
VAFSMTGFATHEVVHPPFRFVWEIRSVNHRYLDLGLRLPEDLRQLEARCRDLVAERIKRGKVDCGLRWFTASRGEDVQGVNPDAVAELLRLAHAITQAYSQAQPLGVADILRWPGVIVEPHPDFAAVTDPVVAGLDGALTALQQARSREGQRIAEFLLDRADSIQALLEAIRPRLAGVQERYRHKLEERLRRLAVEASPERIEQEIGIVTQRLDVEEEVDRLRGHLAELRRVLVLDEPMGRRLDFLIQEMNREANTFASKVQDDELTRGGVDIKVLVEQMREQVQNLE